MLQLLMFILVVYMIAIVYVFSFKAEPFNYMIGTPEYVASDDELRQLITHIWYYKHSIRKPILRHICGDKILGHATLLLRTEDNKFYFTDEQYSAKRKIYLHRINQPQIFITDKPIFFNGVIYKIDK